MRLLPGGIPLDAAQIDYAQSVLRSLSPTGRIIVGLAYDSLHAAERAQVAVFAADIVCRMKALYQPDDEEALADVLLVAVRFDRSSSEAWNEGVFDTLLLPTLRAFAACGMERAIARLCRIIGITRIHAGRTDESVQSILSRIDDALAPALGQRTSDRPALRQVGPADRLTIGILTDYRLADLSGINLLIRILEAYRRRFRDLDRVFLLIERAGIDPPSAPYRARFEAAGVTIVPYDERYPAAPHESAFGNLPEICAGLDLDVLIFYSSYSFALVASRLRLAPLQAFWSVSFDAAPSRHIDLLLSSSAPSDSSSVKTIEGRRWVVVPPSYEFAPRPLGPVRRDGRYAAYGRPLFATVGGCRKIDNDGFLEAVARLLEAFPEAAFLWTEVTNHPYPHLQARMEQHGIATRCHNVGYVEIDQFAPEIDVHLDSFPYGTAEASVKMLAHGCPSVGMATKESLFGYVYNPLLVHGFGDPGRRAGAQALFFPQAQPTRLLIAETIDEYIARAQQVARDPAYRAACAEAYHGVFGGVLGTGDYAAEGLRQALRSAVGASPGETGG